MKNWKIEYTLTDGITIRDIKVTASNVITAIGDVAYMHSINPLLIIKIEQVY